VPPLQVSMPVGQRLSHEPQLKASVFVSVQERLQQVSPAAQTFPQAPQFISSLRRSAQRSVQLSSGGTHVTSHAPVMHTPEGQVVPHVPQLAASLPV